MILKQCSLIRGLQYYRNFISIDEKIMILDIINRNSWCQRLLRKQQYYGIKYYQTKIQDHILQPNISNDHYPLTMLQLLIKRTVEDHHIFDEKDPPNQILVNRYVKSDRLGLHVEDINAFGEIIVGVSLGSTDYLRLHSVEDKSKEYRLELQDRSCYVLKDQARHEYRHGIGRSINSIKYKNDDFQRISLTIRHVIDNRRKVQASSTSQSDVKHCQSLSQRGEHLQIKR